MSPKCMGRRPGPQCDGIWGWVFGRQFRLDQVMRGGPLGEISGEKVAVSASQEEPSPEPDSAGTQPPEMRENTFVVFSCQSVALCHRSVGRRGHRRTTKRGEPGGWGCRQGTVCLNHRVLHFLTYMPAIVETSEVNVCIFPRGQQKLGWEGQR